jgi:hypothetical protein
MRRVRITKVAALAALCLLMAACAQLGPPLPPSLEVPKPPTDLRAVRKGNRVTLTWSEPTLTTDHNSIRYIGPTNICRSEKADMVQCGTPIAALPAPPPAAKTQGRQPKKSPHPTTESYADTLPESALQTNGAAQIFYAVEILNRNNRGGGLSNRVDVPAVITLPPPNDLKAELTGDGVVLSWMGAANPHGEGLDLIYRVYRRQEKSDKDEVAGEIPVADAGAVLYTDAGFEWEKTYLYRVTAVSLVKRTAANGEDQQLQIEGDDSAPVRVVAHDVFPPAVPGGLQAVYSGEGQKPFIDLIWAPVTNADLAGYNVYRVETGAKAATPVKVNAQLVKTPAYRDFEVQPGKSYLYSISAVDMRGNESQKSEAATESVP